jgi:penicillin-binding protein 2
MTIRYYLFRVFVYAGLLVLSLGLFRTQVLQGRRYRHLGDQNRIRLIPLEAPRGRVFDRKGNLLAGNRASYEVVATPEDVTPEVFPLLAKLLKQRENEIRLRMSAAREYPFAPAVIQEDIPLELAFRIEEYMPELPGVSIRISSRRYYPYKETASHLIGYIGKINPDEYMQWDRARFGMTSLVGRAGLEKIFDDRLRGWRGGRQIEVDARGQMIRVLSEKIPEPGEDLVLTLDLEFQKKIMELIEGKHASVAVLDLQTEGLVALASTPAYDPNVFVSPAFVKERLEILRNPESPMLDRGVGSAYPPGSVFKLVTALTALEKNKITPQTRFFCPGTFRLKGRSRPFHCWYEKGHGSLDLYQAIERSCNVYFFNVGRRLSPDDIAEYAHELGLGETMQLETTHIVPGLVPDSVWKKEKYHDDWYLGETLSFAIGQSYLLVSPIQILRLTAIIAKNGQIIEPTILLEKARERTAEGKTAVKEENLKIIRRAMLKVVQSDYGTGQLARVDFAKMAAKTGTAQVPSKTAHSWMTGFFPYENPEIVFVVFVEHGGSGGITSAKIVKEMLEIWRKINAPQMA